MNKQTIIDTFKAEGYEFDSRIINKNGVEKMAYTFRKSGSSIAPTFYLDDEAWGNLTDAEAIETIRYHIDNVPNAYRDIDSIKDFEAIKDKLTVIVNRIFADNIVSRPILNFYKGVVVKIDDNSSIKVTKDILNAWGVSEDELFEIAENNSIDMFNVKTLADKFREMGYPSQIIEGMECAPMYIVTNKSNINGAAFVCCKKYLKNLFNTFGKYFLLPSSIHECIIVPLSKMPDASIEDMNEMVKQISNTEVEPEEVLDYQAYFFNGRNLVDRVD